MSGSRRRRSVWTRTDSLALTVPLNGAAAQVDLLAPFRTANGGAQPPGVTVARVRFSLRAEFTEGVGPQGIRHGLLVDDRTLANADEHSPLSEPFLDWMLLDTTWEGASGSPDNRAWEKYDVKAKRRLDEIGQTLWWICTIQPGADAGAIARIWANVLLLMP